MKRLNKNELNTRKAKILCGHKPTVLLCIGSTIASFGLLWPNILATVLCLTIFFVLFACSIIINRPKLSLIPCAIFFSVILIFHGITHLYVIPSLIIYFMITMLFGTVMGFIYKRASKKSRKHLLVLKTAGVISLVLSSICFVNFAFFGNPIGAYIAYGRIETYVSMFFTDFDFVISFPKYHLQFEGSYYSAKVYERSNSDIFFDVYYSSRSRNVNYVYNIGDFKDTYSNVLRYLISPLYEREFGSSINSIHITQSGSSRIPQYYLNVEFIVSHLDSDALVEMIVTCRDIAAKNKIPLEFYSLRFIEEDIEMRITNLHASHINDGLMQIIERVNDSFDSSGYIDVGHSMKIHYRYGYHTR